MPLSKLKSKYEQMAGASSAVRVWEAPVCLSCYFE